NAVLALTALTVTLAGCAGSTTGGGGTSPAAASPVAVSAAEAGKRLVANRWELVYWEGTPVPHGDNGEPVILTFAEGRVSGHAGCNRMMAGYELGPEAGKILVKAPVATRMACEEGRMKFEAAFTKAFGAANAVRFEGSHMYLDSPGVPSLKFHQRELQGG
ncbi:MAG: META domain-containing protein, partial [Planctomycetota bacterium]